MNTVSSPLAVDTGFTFGEPFALILVGFAIALWAGIAALSHQGERAFSASIVYLAFGLVAAATLALLGAKPLNPLAEPSLLEHLSEVALIIAVFTTGLSLEAKLRWRPWRKVVVLLAVVVPLTIRRSRRSGCWPWISHLGRPCCSAPCLRQPTRSSRVTWGSARPARRTCSASRASR